MSQRTLVWMVLLLVARGGCLQPDLECPEDCDCHYFRINWVTDCSESNLTTIPHEGLSRNVYILNMNSNNVSEVPPFPTDIKLRRLQLADNLVAALTRRSFAGLELLLDADFSGNNISTVEPDTFVDSPGLITLELQENPLEPADGPFLISRSLLYLDLSDCNLTRLSPLFFSNITALNKLDLSKNPLSSLQPAVFDPLSSLEELKLNKCNLTHISDMALFNLTNLNTLELSGNLLKNVHWDLVLGNLGTLELLDLRNSAVMYLPEDAFVNNTWLRSLILAENELKDVDMATALGNNLHRLDTLDLSHCELRGPLSQDAFANATNLRTIILSGNHLSAEDLAVALAPLTRLHKLSLRNCGLTRLPDNTFHRFTSLQELDISHNPLNDAFTGILAPLDTLEFLDMGYSNLRHISRNTFSEMTHLKRLILSGNNLETLVSGLFQNLTDLETLELNNCGLTSPPDASVFVSNETYADLQELKLSGNPLEVSEAEPLLPRQLSRLRQLDMSNCNLTTLPKVSFKWAQNIVHLKLSGNRLGAVPNSLDFVKTLPHLETLDLTHCNMTHINPGYFVDNPKLTSLRLTGNPWKCDCSLSEMWEWASISKQDLGLLVGSTTSPDDVTAGSAKRKKALVCVVDSTQALSPKTPSRLRLRDQSYNRTWARFIKDAGCPPSKFQLAERFMAYRDEREAARSIHAMYNLHESPPTWIIAVACVSVVVFLATAIATGMALLLRKVRKAQAKNRRQLEQQFDCPVHVDNSGVIELMKYYDEQRRRIREEEEHHHRMQQRPKPPC